MLRLTLTLTVKVTTDPNPNLNAVPIVHLCNAECRTHKNAQYYCIINKVSIHRASHVAMSLVS